MYFEFNVLVVYREFTGEYKKVTYRFFAKSTTHAEKIARELLYLTDGIPEQDLQFVIKYVKPNVEIIERLLPKIKNYVDGYKALVSEDDYSAFLERFKKDKGYGVKFGVGGKIKEYYVDYANMTYKLMFKEGSCKIDENYLVYHEPDKNKDYFIADNYNKFVICKT